MPSSFVVDESGLFKQQSVATGKRGYRPTHDRARRRKMLKAQEGANAMALLRWRGSDPALTQ
jgi:ribosomal protein S6E (S10)